MGDTEITGLLKAVHNAGILKSFTDGPKCENKGQPGKKAPSFRQIEYLEWLGTETDHAFLFFDIRTLVRLHKLQRIIADEQRCVVCCQHCHKVGLGWPEVWIYMIKLIEDDLR